MKRDKLREEIFPHDVFTLPDLSSLGPSYDCRPDRHLLVQSSRIQRDSSREGEMISLHWCSFHRLTVVLQGEVRKRVLQGDPTGLLLVLYEGVPWLK